ncbi:MAG: phosphatase PAP2 family protein [Gemmatimonas sp.]|nr:phosphatase PAP2 family protein [Gemmatimonas sp.]
MTAWLLRLQAHDERILHALVLRRWRVADRLMNGVTRLGDAVSTIGVTSALCASWSPRLQTTGAFAAVALVSSHLGVQILKRTVTRSRPRLPVGCASLIQAPDRFSFPSGHAAASLSVGIALALAVPPPASAAILFLALVVGISRCYLGVHYPGDVLAGWFLALSGAALAAFVL